jgi:hypothetical protein
MRDDSRRWPSWAALVYWRKWPSSRIKSWIKGFLAGIFDAEGTGVQCLRIANTDTEIIDWVRLCLAELGFQFGMHGGNALSPAFIAGERRSPRAYALLLDHRSSNYSQAKHRR